MKSSLESYYAFDFISSSLNQSGNVQRRERLGGVLGLKFSGYVLPELRRGTAAGKVGMPLGTYLHTADSLPLPLLHTMYYMYYLPTYIW